MSGYDWSPQFPSYLHWDIGERTDVKLKVGEEKEAVAWEPLRNVSNE